MTPRTEPTDTTDDGFTAFVAAGWRRYLWTASVLTGDRHAGEELLQECLVKLYTRWRRVARDGDPHAYLRRMLVNGNVSRWRRWLRERPMAETPDRSDGRSAPVEPHDALQRAVLRLPRQQRAVIVLRYFEDLTEKEAAAVLGCSVGAIKSTHSRAMAKLRAESALLETRG
ncbi:SigE family RNA polymerase sigma factor [Actinoplanes sp. NPDC051861]|uniref:SigE family RNA polymerase sigma factor n=1 Tax=Actinoplanes sp. NPDC051861 TaxID=3155170 RepID=UPI003436ADB1